jgi:hypothetical protein
VEDSNRTGWTLQVKKSTHPDALMRSLIKTKELLHHSAAAHTPSAVLIRLSLSGLPKPGEGTRPPITNPKGDSNYIYGGKIPFLSKIFKNLQKSFCSSLSGQKSDLGHALWPRVLFEK